MSSYLFRTVTSTGYSFLSQHERNLMGSLGWSLICVAESKVAQQYIFGKTEDRWEYKTLVVKPDQEDVILNELGEESWELVSVVSMVRNSALYVKLYFKRPKQNS